MTPVPLTVFPASPTCCPLSQALETAPAALCVLDADGRLKLLNRRARAIFPGHRSGASFQALLDGVGAILAADCSELQLADGSCFSLAESVSDDGKLRVIMLAETTLTRRAEEERRRMLEFLSHDMRAPQLAILGLAQEQAACEPEPERLQRIRRLARRTLELADGFVQLSRLSEVSLEFEEVDLAGLVGEVLDRAWFAAREKGIELVRDIPDEPVRFSGDGHVLSRAIDNLVDNAIRHGPIGSRVMVSVRAVGSRIRLAIRDEGEGLPEGRRKHPFQRFGPRGKAAGAGLGLSFVKLAIEKHGGTIACRSRRGRGTAFVIHLNALGPE